MNHREYMRRIEGALGQIKAADRIQEGPWFDVVVKQLNDLSKQCAMELQEETHAYWGKPGYLLQLHEAPPTRLLALQMVLASWLGWIMREKHGEKGTFSTSDCRKRFLDAFSYGVELSRKGERP
jgi:hypothetical protein